MTHGIAALVFRCKVIGGHPAETDEARAFRWVTADQVRELASGAFAIRVLDAMHHHQAPAIRHHDGTHTGGLPPPKHYAALRAYPLASARVGCAAGLMCVRRSRATETRPVKGLLSVSPSDYSG